MVASQSTLLRREDRRAPLRPSPVMIFVSVRDFRAVIAHRELQEFGRLPGPPHGNPICRSASYATKATQLDRFSDRASGWAIGMCNQ